MKPPWRASRQSTARTLVTRALTSRPSTSNRTTSPSRMPDRSRRLCSMDTSGVSVRPAPQNRPSTTRSFGCRRSRHVTVNSRRSPPGAPHVLAGRSSCSSAPETAVTRARRTGMAGGGGVPVNGLAATRATPSACAGCTSMRNMSAASPPSVTENWSQQVRLQRAHADDEERAEADRRAGRRASGCPGRVRRSTAWRSATDARRRQRADRADERGAHQRQHGGDRRRARPTRPARSEASRPASWRSPRARPSSAASAPQPHPVAPAGAHRFAAAAATA